MNDRPLPPVDKSHEPPFYQLDWQKWERLTIAVFEREPEIANASAYGVSGQGQAGIDVVGQRIDDASEVASCKVRMTITAANLIEWSDDFLDHWESHWKSRNVRRFVLATTATNTADRKIQDQIAAEQQRFRALGIRYELWGAGQFAARLRSDRVTVARYLPDPWPDILCGPAVNAAPEQTGGANLLGQVVVQQLGELQRVLSGQVAIRAESALHLLRTGDMASVRAFIEELRAPDAWGQLNAEAQAKVIRLEVSLRLKEGDLEEASRLAAEARVLEPASERRSEAQIALERSGPDAALAELGVPTSMAGRQLLAILMLVKGENAKAAAILDQLHEEGVDAETWRLSALNRLALGDRPGALEAVHQAEALAADWTAVLQAGIVVRYAHSLSPAVVGAEWLFYPNPVEGSLVREDDASQALLAEALKLVERLIPVAEQSEGKLWKLALLANRRNGREAASEWARILLGGRPNELPLIAWVVNRGLDVDLAPSLAALKDEYAAGTSPMVTRILGLLLFNIEPETAAEFLSTHLRQQEGESREEAERWIARIEGRPEPEPAQDESILPVALRLGREEGQWADVARLASERLTVDPPQMAGLSLAEALAESEQWTLLAPLAARIALFQTASAVRLAAYILYNNGSFAEMLALLETNQDLFGPALPDSLQRLRIRALLQTGRPQQGLAELEKISEAASIDMRLLTAEVRASIGDVRAGIPIIREALRQGELDPMRALQWSQMLQGEDPALAQQLWRAANKEEVEGPLAVALLDQAYRLGLDRETAALMPQIQAHAAAGGPEVRMVSLDEVQEILAKARETSEDIWRQYRNGALPAHLVVRKDDAAFLKIFAQADPTDPRLDQRLIRSGARPRDMRIETAWTDLVIHLDISGLIIAEQLGLLDFIEQTREPIRIPTQLPTILMLMERGIQPVQPSQTTARAQAWDAITAGTVNLSSVRCEAADAIAVEAGDETGPGVGALVRGLRARGLITDAQCEQVLTQVSDPKPDVLDLDGIGTIRFDLFGLVDIAGARLIRTLGEHFRLEADPDVRDALRLEIRRAAEQDRLAGLARRLRERVAGNIEVGRFKLLEPLADSEKDSDEDMGPGLLARSLGDLLRAPPVDNGVAWFDDRLISSYSRTASMPTVGTVEILQTLLFEGLLSPEEYRQKMLGLRALGACFVPFDPDEITAPLADAPVADGAIIETEELRILRRSFAAGGLLEEQLQIAVPGTANPNGRPDEMEYPRTVMRLLGECLDPIWKHVPIDVERAYAQSDWLWFSIREAQLNRRIPGDDPAAAQDQFEAIQVSHMLDKAFDIGGIRDERQSLREGYLNWVWQRCIQPRAASDPSFLDRIGVYLADFYRGLIDDSAVSEDPTERRLISSLFALRLERLPDPIRERVIQTGKFPDYVTVRQTQVLGRLRFDPVQFWRAVRRARRYGKAQLRTISGRRIRMVRDGASLKVSGQGRFRLADPLNDVVAARAHELAAALGAYFESIDLMPAERERVCKLIAPHMSPHEIAAAISDLREDAPSRRYDLLQVKLATKRRIDVESLSPGPTDRMLEFAGLGGNDRFDFEGAWQALSSRVGNEEAYRRLSKLPVRRASSMLASLGDGELEELALGSEGPVPFVHLLAEAHRRDWPAERQGELVEILIRMLAEIGPLYVELLRWSEKAFLKDPEFIKLDAARRLALIWLHAGELLELFIRNRTSPGPVADYLEANPPYLSIPQILEKVRSEDDSAAPVGLSWKALLYHALGEIFDGDDVNDMLPDMTVQRVTDVLRISNEGVEAPDGQLLRRVHDAPDAMGSFLTRKPAGVLNGNLDPDAIRHALANANLDAIENGGGEIEASWYNLGATAMLGLDTAQRERLSALVKRADIYNLALHDGKLEPLVWRAILSGMLPQEYDWVRQAFYQIARRCRASLGQVVAGREEASAAIEQLVELAARIAACTEGDRTLALADLILGIAMNWPEAAAKLRDVTEHTLAGTPARDAQNLWKLHLNLNSMR